MLSPNTLRYRVNISACGFKVPQSFRLKLFLFNKNYLYLHHILEKYQADVAELVDASDLGSGAARRGGSSPFIRTITNPPFPHETEG